MLTFTFFKKKHNFKVRFGFELRLSSCGHDGKTPEIKYVWIACASPRGFEDQNSMVHILSSFVYLAFRCPDPSLMPYFGSYPADATFGAGFWTRGGRRGGRELFPGKILCGFREIPDAWRVQADFFSSKVEDLPVSCSDPWSEDLLNE